MGDQPLVHRPGLPGDLPAPELLWARWAAVAVVTARDEASMGRYPTGCWIDAGGLHLDDCGSTWWTLRRYDGGRAVLYGEDESSDVKWHKPAVDMLAGAPEWLPYATLRDLLEGYELGCVYWYENGAWARAPYPDDLRDDGLDCGIRRFLDPVDVLDTLGDHLDADVDGAAARTLLDHAERSTVTPEVLDTFLATTEADTGSGPARLRALRRAGLDGSGAFPVPEPSEV
ncbi:hypothetical protein [Streptomyces sp. NPDC059092]|uniref:hypothetical protein n=1 Tax=Streptomyces sp. NPDC059092 TaxID=3346725 RepID=UPI0036A03972